jgi:hypothetical protein
MLLNPVSIRCGHNLLVTGSGVCVMTAQHKLGWRSVWPNCRTKMCASRSYVDQPTVASWRRQMMQFRSPLASFWCYSITMTCCTPMRLHLLLRRSRLRRSPIMFILTRTKLPLMELVTTSFASLCGRQSDYWPRITRAISPFCDDRWSMMSAGFAQALMDHKITTWCYVLLNKRDTFNMFPTCCTTGDHCRHQRHQMHRQNRMRLWQPSKQSLSIYSAVTPLLK